MKFLNKYRIKSTRATWWDYSWNGFYFITICTYARIPYFGNVLHDKLFLSEAGQVAADCWNEIPNHFPFVRLGPYIVMPNHIHGILVIDKQFKISTTQRLRYKKLYNKNAPVKNKFGPQSKNLASIVRGYKIGVKKKVRQFIPDFDWQRRYDDRIIRSNKAFYLTSRYIRRNPSEWTDDEFYLSY